MESLAGFMHHSIKMGSARICWGEAINVMQAIALVEALVTDDYKTVYLRAKAENICIICKERVGSFRDQSSRLEYSISAICQECQDSLFRRC